MAKRKVKWRKKGSSRSTYWYPKGKSGLTNYVAVATFGRKDYIVLSVKGGKRKRRIFPRTKKSALKHAKKLRRTF